MGREVRHVPKNWIHPKRDNGRYEPLHDQGYEDAEKDWVEEREKWLNNPCEDMAKDKKEGGRFSDWHGRRPDPDDYMPVWSSEEATHIQMYENTSEGTPVSPVMDTPENLARWLADNGASSFGRSTATYEQWLSMCKAGWAPSMIVDGGVVMSGVEACKD